MINKIYEVIADKTLSFGCKIKAKTINTEFPIWWENYKEPFVITYRKWIPTVIYLKDNRDDFEIIWHPVMIWDVYHWWAVMDERVQPTDKYIMIRNDIHTYWKYYRKPIEEQPEHTIDFIYSLIS